MLPVVMAIAFVVVAVVAVCVAREAVNAHEDEISTERYIRAMEEEDARRNVIQYAKAGFLDSFPPNVTISDETGVLYAKNEDGSYSELRARKKTWIQNIPVKEDVIRKYKFNSEGFHELTKTIAYYDWYPTRDPEIPLQKVYTHLELAPKTSPLLPYCSELAEVPAYENACNATIFSELMGRAFYERLIKEHKEKQESENISAQNSPSTPANGTSSANAVPVRPTTGTPAENTETIPYPEKLYGEIRIHTDTPETKVFFMGEPLMMTKESGSMVQVRVQPDAPYAFSTFGNQRPIPISDPLSIRLEAPGLPPFVTEILTHQWHCTPVSKEEALKMAVPPYLVTDNSMVHLQHLCRYSIDIDVSFSKIKAASEIK